MLERLERLLLHDRTPAAVIPSLSKPPLPPSVVPPTTGVRKSKVRSASLSSAEAAAVASAAAAAAAINYESGGSSHESTELRGLPPLPQRRRRGSGGGSRLLKSTQASTEMGRTASGENLHGSESPARISPLHSRPPPSPQQTASPGGKAGKIRWSQRKMSLASGAVPQHACSGHDSNLAVVSRPEAADGQFWAGRDKHNHGGGENDNGAAGRSSSSDCLNGGGGKRRARATAGTRTDLVQVVGRPLPDFVANRRSALHGSLSTGPSYLGEQQQTEPG